MKRIGCLTVLALVGALFVTSTPAAACGEDNQPACQRRVSECFTDVDTGIPYCGFNNEYYCNYTSLQVEGWWNKTCVHRNKGAGLTCCTAVNYTDTYGGQSTPVTEGYYARVDLNEAWIIVPNQNNPDWCATGSYKNAVMSVPEWGRYGVYNARLMVNANFFDPGRNPYLFSCNNALGLTVSNKTLLSPDGSVHGSPTASLIFFTPDQVRARGINALIASNAYRDYGPQIQNAVSGFRLLENGNFVEQPTAIDPNLKRPRTAVGLKDGNTLFLVVVNPGFDDSGRPGATTLHGLADFMKRDLGVVDALTLDGSGSSQFFYHDPDSGTEVTSKPSDTQCYEMNPFFKSDHCYRPVPVFLGIQ
jgi:uncharacterized protein YigE (DUF2233 family)